VKDQLGVDLPEPELPEPAVEEVPEEPERPEWLPEKFKDEREFAESYRNLETELRTRAESQKDLEARIDQLTNLVEQIPQQANQQPQYGQDQNQVQEQLMASFESDPIGTMVFLANAAADQRFQNFQQQQAPQYQAQQQLQGELIADNASRLLESRYPDWRDYETRVGEMIDANPNLLPEQVLGSLDQTAAAFEAIYKQAKYEDLVAQLAEAQSGQSSEQMKRQAQTATGAGTRPPAPSEVDQKMDQLLAAARGSSYSAFRGAR
jgi:hypothetical protein